jgi:hypothetical protein
MESELECEFCNKNFSTISNLRYHKKTNKKCQIIQKENIDLSSFVNCLFCNKIFTNQTIKIHNKTCKKKINEEIKRLQIENEEIKKLQLENYEEIKKLQIEKEENKKLLNEKNEELRFEKDENKKLHIRVVELETENKIYLQDREVVQKMAMQPKNNNNKIKINNNFFDNPEKIKQMINDKLNKDYICDGQKGVAQFAYNNLLKDEEGNMNYICSDPSRHIFKFHNSEGNIEKDVKAIKLTNMLIEAGITNKALSVAPSLWTEDDGKINSNKFQTYGPYTTEISSMQLDNSIFRNELASLAS